PSSMRSSSFRTGPSSRQPDRIKKQEIPTMTPLAKECSPLAFLLVYVRARPRHFGTLAGLVIGAGACAVAVQYGMKRIVDARAATDRAAADVWPPLLLFVALIAVESVLCSGNAAGF